MLIYVFPYILTFTMGVNARGVGGGRRNFFVWGCFSKVQSYGFSIETLTSELTGVHFTTDSPKAE
jgi:hypothetical protein